jgi:hypothetical protein
MSSDPNGNESNAPGEPGTPSKRRAGMDWDEILVLLERATTDRYEVVEQAAFLKVVGPQGHRMYIAKQGLVRRIDLAFTPADMDGIIPIRKPNGNAKWELDTSPVEALTRMEKLLIWMLDAPAETVEKKRAFVPSLPKAIAQRRQAEANDPAAKEERRKRIESVAREKGVSISPNADI